MCRSVLSQLMRRSLVFQEGTSNGDVINHAIATDDGAGVFFGLTGGDWTATSAGSWDFAVTKIHSNGTVLWRWQVRRQVLVASMSGHVVLNEPRGEVASLFGRLWSRRIFRPVGTC